MSARTRHVSTTAALFAVLLALTGASSARAASPWWQLASSTVPTNLAPGGEGKVVVGALNIGDGETGGEEVELNDQLPEHLTLQAVHLYATRSEKFDLGAALCTPAVGSVRCRFPSGLHPYERLELVLEVAVAVNAQTGELNEMSVEGGGAPSASVRRPIVVDPTPTAFGVEDYEVVPEDEGGEVDTQAGSHPFQLTTSLAFASTIEPGVHKEILNPPTAPALPRDIRLDLPPGLVGNASAIPQCSVAQFSTFATFGGKVHNLCPADSAVGVASVTVNEPLTFGLVTGRVPVFNVTPNEGEPARFGFEVVHVPVFLDTSVRTGGDYGVTISVNDLAQTAATISSRVTLWGVPGDPRHAQSRGWACLNEESECSTQSESNPSPFLTLPTSCGQPLSTSVSVESWKSPELLPAREYLLSDHSGAHLGLDGCDQLRFDPSLHATPESSAASSPSGLTVRVHVPQESTASASGLAEADVKDTTVTLPPGMQVNPSSANGLEACSEAEIGFQSDDGGSMRFTSEAGQPFCPDAAKVGTVEEIRTPLLPNPLRGSVYLAAQGANPFGSLIALYLFAEDPVSGVRLKLAGEVRLDPQTGQMTASFENTPPLPFEDLKLHFFGGARAPLATPPGCGTYSTVASFTPWSGGPSAASKSSFTTNQGVDGGPCPSSQPFAPAFTGGSANLQAGAFTPFTVTVDREDGEQPLGTVQIHTPVGLLGMLSSVSPCPEPAASEGMCGPESLIGQTVVSAGVGGDPYAITGGRIYLTGGYSGAPYGLTFAEPAKAGPFDLGGGRCDCIVVRARIEVDPYTSALTVTSDPLPTILDGVPLQIKRIDATIDRTGFMFNPTDCAEMQLHANISSAQGGSTGSATPFRVANCATLPFKPKFTAITQAKTSKANGASLHVRVLSGVGQANIAKVKVDLPKQLPSRLSTLQKACTAALFAVNPAGCPPGSLVGTAVAATPVLKHVLTGPAYLVSHGGAAFPDLEIVLQGEGITLILDGNTQIKKGVTSSIFRSIPDAPIDSFDLVLSEGPHSALAAFLPAKAGRSMCGQVLSMPTEITGQNGAVVKQGTRIGVAGCPRAKRRRHTSHAHRKRRS